LKVAKPTVPAVVIKPMPNARWCRCTPPVTTLPGHHGTRGLRIRRVLSLMKPKEARKPTSTRKRACL
jgi:hypothetical protein